MTDTQANLVARLRVLAGLIRPSPDEPIPLLISEAADELERLWASNKQMREALQELLEAFSLGPLGCAAKYGPDVDVREVEGRAVDMARAALKRAEAKEAAALTGQARECSGRNSVAGLAASVAPPLEDTPADVSQSQTVICQSSADTEAMEAARRIERERYVGSQFIRDARKVARAYVQQRESIIEEALEAVKALKMYRLPEPNYWVFEISSVYAALRALVARKETQDE